MSDHNHENCGCGHDHSPTDAAKSPVIKANMSSAIGAFLKGLSKLTATFEEISGVKVALNMAAIVGHDQQPEIPEGQTAILKASFGRNLNMWHPEDLHLPKEDRRVIEAPAMVNVFDLSPTLLTYVPKDPEILMSGVVENTSIYEDLPGGYFSIMNGQVLYMGQVDQTLSSLGVMSEADFSNATSAKAAELLGIPQVAEAFNRKASSEGQG